MKERLEFKVFGIGIIILIVGVVGISLLVFFIIKANVNSIITHRLEATSKIITKSIEETMLEAKEEITKDLIEKLKSVSGFTAIEVYNDEGKEAFKPDASLVETESLKKVKDSHSSLVLKKGSILSFYMPLENQARCQGCHGAEKAILGAVKLSASTQKEEKRVKDFMLLITFGGIIGIGVLGMLFREILKRFVIRPLERLKESALKMAEGDLSFKTHINTNDEIGELNRAIRGALSSISTILQRIKEVGDRIAVTTSTVESSSDKMLENTETEAEAVANISSSVEELNAAIGEIADSTESLASSSEQTASSTEEMASSTGSVTYITHELSEGIEATSSSIEEMSATIRQVAESAELLARLSEETLSAVEEIIYSIKEVELSAKESARLSEKVTEDASTIGVSSINKTMEGMQKIKTSVEKTAGVIKKLGGRSEEIGKILTVIDDITDQTALLALNAAILASQAGEHGKGFAVVADEIKDLAERTAFSTQEIDTLIGSVRGEVKDAIDAMQEGMVSVEEGLPLSKGAGDALKKILQSSKSSSEMAFSIERSTGEQAKAARLVTESIEKVRSMVGQIARATSEQSKGITFIMNAAEKMKNASYQVKTASEQQSSVSKQIAQAVEIISEKSQHISRAVYEQKVGSGQIRDSVSLIKDIPLETKDIAFKINKALRELTKDSELVIAEIEKFKLLEEKDTTTINFGVMPLESPADMYRKFTPLINYLAKKTGRRINMKVAGDYETAIKDIGKGITQLCYMTPSTYIKAHSQYGVNLLVKALRDGRPFQRSVLITKAKSGIRSVSDLKGKSFAFGDINSTLSHILPRAMLLEEGVELKDLSYYNYLGHHDDIVKAVLKEEFDAGGVIESIINRFKGEDLYFIKFSDEIPEMNICVSTSLSTLEQSAISSALSELNEMTDEGAEILHAIDKHYTGFMEAKDEDYIGVRLMMSKIGML